MKRLVLALLVAPMVSFAQQPPQFDREEMMRQFGNPESMQKMAEQAQAMQTCMAVIDQAKLEALGREAQKLSEEIERLCEAGKKDQALTKAMSTWKRMSKNPELEKVRECTKGLEQMMKDMPFAMVPSFDEKDEPTRDDICR